MTSRVQSVIPQSTNGGNSYIVKPLISRVQRIREKLETYWPCGINTSLVGQSGKTGDGGLNGADLPETSGMKYLMGALLIRTGVVLGRRLLACGLVCSISCEPRIGKPAGKDALSPTGLRLYLG